VLVAECISLCCCPVNHLWQRTFCSYILVVTLTRRVHQQCSLPA
jgi:hypothetical protein